MNFLLTIATISLGLLSSATPSFDKDLPSAADWTVFHDRDFYGYYDSMNRVRGIKSAKKCAAIASADDTAMLAVWDAQTESCKILKTFPQEGALMFVPSDTNLIPFSMGYTITGTYVKRTKSVRFKNGILNENKWVAECDVVFMMSEFGVSSHYCERFLEAKGRFLMLPTTIIDSQTLHDLIAANLELPSPDQWILFRDKGMFDEYNGVTRYLGVGSAKWCADITFEIGQPQMAVWEANTHTCKLKSTYPHGGSSLYVSSDIAPFAKGYAFMGDTLKVAQSDCFSGDVQKENDWAEPCDVVLKIVENDVSYQVCKAFNFAEDSILMLPRS